MQNNLPPEPAVDSTMREPFSHSWQGPNLVCCFANEQVGCKHWGQDMFPTRHQNDQIISLKKFNRAKNEITREKGRRTWISHRGNLQKVGCYSNRDTQGKSFLEIHHSSRRVEIHLMDKCAPRTAIKAQKENFLDEDGGRRSMTHKGQKERLKISHIGNISSIEYVNGKKNGHRNHISSTRRLKKKTISKWQRVKKKEIHTRTEPVIPVGKL